MPQIKLFVRKYRQSLRTTPKYLLAINITFGLLLMLFVGYGIVSPEYPQYRHSILFDAAAAMVILGALRSSKRLRAGIGHLSLLVENRKALGAVFACLFLLQIAVARALAIHPLTSGWDPITMYQSTMDFLKSPLPYPGALGYLKVFSNTLGIVVLLGVWLKLCAIVHLTNYVMLAIVLNAIFMNVALILMVLLAKRVAGPRASLFALGFGIIFITFSLWSSTFYSDSIGLFFPIASAYILLKFKESPSVRWQLLWASLLGLTVGCGYLIKPTVIFVVCAAALITGLNSLLQSQHSPKKAITPLKQRLLAVSLGLCVYVLCAIGGQQLIAHDMHIKLTTMPASHFAMMGLATVCQPTSCRYGAWNLPDALLLSKFPTMDAYKQYTQKEIEHRLVRLGPVGYAKFLVRKGAWITTDGTFYAYQEGTAATAPLLYTDPFSRGVQQALHPGGRIYDLSQNAFEIAWLVLVFGVIITCFTTVVSTDYMLAWFRLALFMLIAFLLLFEARSRYLYLYVPIWITIVAYYLFPRSSKE